MFNQLKDIKTHWLLLVASAISLIIAICNQNEIASKGIVSWGIGIATLLFFLSGIAYRFRNLPYQYKTAPKEARQHILLTGGFFFISLIYFLTKEPGIDDLQFSKVLDESTLFQFLEKNHETWSSRNFIESILVPLTTTPALLWQLLTAMVYSVLAEDIIELTVRDKREYGIVVYVLMFCLIPENILSDAGWVATTLNYLWPAAAFLTVMLVVRKMLCGEGISAYDKVQAIVLTLFAANMEVLSVALLGTLMVFPAYQIVVKKKGFGEWMEKTSKFYLAVFAVALLVFIFDITTPGNAARSVSEAGNNFPEYLTFNLFEKFELGFLSTMQYFYAGGFTTTINFGVAALTLITCILLWRKGHKKTALLQLMSVAVILTDHILVVKGIDSWFFLANDQIPKTAKIGQVVANIELALYLFMFVALLLGVYYALDKSQKGLLASAILLIGFCCRFALGFSPTAYVARPYVFTIVAIIMVCTLLLADLLEKRLTTTTKAALIGFGLTIYGIAITKLAIYQIDTDTNIVKMAELVDGKKLENLALKTTPTDSYKEGFHIDTNHREPVPEGNKLICDKKYGLSLKGWAFEKESNEPLGNIYVIAGERIMKGNYGNSREDVAEVFGTVKNVGFNINIPIEYLLDKDGQLANKLQFVLVGPDNRYMYAPITYKLEDPDKSIDKLPTRKFETTENNYGLHIESCNNKPQAEGDNTLVADSETGLAVSGWAFDAQAQKAYGDMFVLIGDKFIQANYGTNRKDVADFFKLTDQNLGFNFNIAVSEIKGTANIAIIFVSPDGSYKYEPITIGIK